MSRVAFFPRRGKVQLEWPKLFFWPCILLNLFACKQLPDSFFVGKTSLEYPMPKASVTDARGLRWNVCVDFAEPLVRSLYRVTKSVGGFASEKRLEDTLLFCERQCPGRVGIPLSASAQPGKAQKCSAQITEPRRVGRPGVVASDRAPGAQIAQGGSLFQVHRSGRI